MTTSLSINDPARLQTLQDLDLLDSPFEAAFDRLTNLAAKILNAPVALVSLVDDHRQFFKSFVGLAEPWASRRETPLSHSFCQYVVNSGAPLVVEDARLDDQLRDNLAIPDLGVIGYAGMPMTTKDNQTLGSFCVIDTKPRKWTAQELDILSDFRDLLMTEIELRSTVIRLRAESAERERLQEEVIRLQAQTLDALSTPLIPVSDKIMVMPLIGSIDSRRAQYIIETLMQGVARQRVEWAIIDITGVPIVDTQVAATLIQVTQAVRLLGTTAVLTGIRPEIAQTLVSLGVNLDGIMTYRNLQQGIQAAMASFVR